MRRRSSSAARARRRLRRRIVTLSLFLLVIVAPAWYIFRPAPQVPMTALALALQSEAFLIPGKYEHALELLNRAVATEPSSWTAYYHRAQAKEGLGDVNGALSDYDSTLRLNPNLIEARNGRAALYILRGEYPRAVDDLTKGIAIKATVQAYISRGQAYASMGEHQKAINDFTWAIDATPYTKQVYLSRANSRRAIGDLKGAQEDEDIAARGALDMTGPKP